jgi:chromosome segregation ATPase
VVFLYVLNKVLYNDKKSGRLSNLLEYQEKIDTLLGELKYVKAENSTLKENNNDLKCQIHYLENTIKEFEERGLEMKYVEILKLLQLLNISTERLPDSIQDIKTTLQFELNRVFDTYGYKMVEYSSETTSFYDVDYQPIDNPQLNVRAIINKDNNIAVKGKIYLPRSYGKNIK